MQRVWNYFLYSTWWLLNQLGEKLFRKPIHGTMYKLFPFLRKNKGKAYSSYKKTMNDRDFSFNIAFAFGYMFFTTMFIYADLFLYLGHFLQLEVGKNLHYWFIGVVVLSYLTNQVLSWGNDKYLKYFAEFDNINDKKKIYLPAVLFHVGVLLFTALSVHWTIGYNF